MMIREGFDRRLRALQHDILLLGSMAATAVERSVAALKARDGALAQTVIDDDEALDDLAYQIEERALLLIATQQPLAGDLRTIAAVIAINSELERIGDYAEGIAKIALVSLHEPPLKPLIDIPRMAEHSVEMLRRSLAAFIDRDVIACRTIWAEDDLIDRLQDEVLREMLTYMSADPATIARGTRLLWVSHNLERIADRVTNICEHTIAMVTGERPALVPPQGISRPATSAGARSRTADRWPGTIPPRLRQ
jgi:phosphate transport system protein